MKSIIYLLPYIANIYIFDFIYKDKICIYYYHLVHMTGQRYSIIISPQVKVQQYIARHKIFCVHTTAVRAKAITKYLPNLALFSYWLCIKIPSWIWALHTWGPAQASQPNVSILNPLYSFALRQALNFSVFWWTRLHNGFKYLFIGMLHLAG